MARVEAEYNTFHHDDMFASTLTPFCRQTKLSFSIKWVLITIYLIVRTICVELGMFVSPKCSVVAVVS